MKKIILFVFLVMSISLVYAELEVDIPFDLDIVGDSYTTTGPYVYTSEWITITNIGSTSETYTLFYSDENVPADWHLSICNSTGTCFMANYPAPIPLEPGEVLEIDISITVASTGGFPFSIILDEGDLTEPMIFDFTFNTADNVSADDGLVLLQKLSQNYPNPFNPTTTISYELTQQELANAGITIYNTKGQIVRTFRDLSLDGNVVWNGRNDEGNIVNSGVYFYKLNGIDTSKVRKMILMK